jgi:hypothetical protein
MPIYIDLPMKTGILALQLRGNSDDSNPRLQSHSLGFLEENRWWNPKNGRLPANRDLSGIPRNAANGPRIADDSSLTTSLPSG